MKMFVIALAVAGLGFAGTAMATTALVAGTVSSVATSIQTDATGDAAQTVAEPETQK